MIPQIIGAGSALFGGAGALVTGAGALATGAASFLGQTAVGVGSLSSGLIQTGAGFVKGTGTALFAGGTKTPGLTVGQNVAGETLPGGLFSNLFTFDTLANIASLGYSVYQSEEDRRLAAKAIDAQRKLSYIAGAPTTSLAPTTSVVIPGTAAAAKQLQTEVLIKYAFIIGIGYLLLKGVKL